jgi:hypothetical protein
MSDRSNNALLNSARVASNVDILLPNVLANQLDQRLIAVDTSPATTALNVQINYVWWMARFDRAIKVVDARIFPTANVASNGTNFSVINLWSSPDNGTVYTSGAVVGTLNTGNVALTSYQSQALTLNAANVVLPTVPVGQVLTFATLQNGGANSPNLSNAILQIVYQEI